MHKRVPFNSALIDANNSNAFRLQPVRLFTQRCVRLGKTRESRYKLGERELLLVLVWKMQWCNQILVVNRRLGGVALRRGAAGFSVCEKAEQQSTHLKPSVNAAEGMSHQLTPIVHVQKVDAAQYDVRYERLSLVSADSIPIFDHVDRGALNRVWVR